MLARLRQEVSTADGHPLRPLVVAADFTVLSRLGSMDFGAVSDRAPFRGSWNEYSLREDVFWYLSHMPGASTLEHACVRERARARARGCVFYLSACVRVNRDVNTHADVHIQVFMCWCGAAGQPRC